MSVDSVPSEDSAFGAEVFLGLWQHDSTLPLSSYGLLPSVSSPLLKRISVTGLRVYSNPGGFILKISLNYIGKDLYSKGHFMRFQVEI